MELEVFAGVSGQVQCLAYASGGATLALGSENGLVYLWDPSREKLIKVLDGRGGTVTSVAFAPHGSLLAAGYSDCITRLWDIETGRLLHSLKGHQLPVTGIAFAPDGEVIASVSPNHHGESAVLLYTSAGEEMPKIQNESLCPECVAFSPMGNTLAVGSLDGGVQLWDAQTRKLKAALPEQGDAGPVTSVAFAPDGYTLAVGYADSVVRLWDVRERQLMGELHQSVNGGWGVTSLAYAPNGKVLASGFRDGGVQVWDLSSTPVPHTLIDHDDAIVPMRAASLAFAPTTALSVLASGMRFGGMRLWNAETREVAQEIHNQPRVSPITCSSSGRFLAYAFANGVALWDVKSGYLTDAAFDRGQGDAVFAPDSDELATRALDGVQLWELDASKVAVRLVRLLTDPGGPPISLTFASKKKFLAASYSTKVWTWDLATDQQLSGIEPKFGVDSVALSPNGDVMAVSEIAEGVRVTLWDTTTGQLRCAGQAEASRHDKVTAMVFAPDSQILAVGHRNNRVSLLDANSGSGIRSIGLDGAGANSVAFAPDGSAIAVGCNDGKIRLFNCPTGDDPIRVLEGRRSPVDSLLFDQNGSRLWSGHQDGTIRAWAVGTGQLLASLLALPSMNWIAWTPGGYYQCAPGAEAKFLLQRADQLTGASLPSHSQRHKVASALDGKGDAAVPMGVDREYEENSGSWHLVRREGLNWSGSWVDEPGLRLNSIYATADGMNLWMAGDGGSLLHSSDGGRTWECQQVEAPAGVLLRSVELRSVFASADGRKVWAVGQDQPLFSSRPKQGLFFCSADGGNNWRPQKMRVDGIPVEIHGNSDGTLLAVVVCNDEEARGERFKLYLLSDDRLSDSGVRFPGCLPPYCGLRVSEDGSTLWLYTAASISSSTDGGKNWRKHGQAPTGLMGGFKGETCGLQPTRFRSEGSLAVWLYPSRTQKRLLYYSANAGESWDGPLEFKQLRHLNPSDSHYLGNLVHVASARSDLFAVHSRGEFVHIRPSGAQVPKQAVPLTPQMPAVPQSALPTAKAPKYDLRLIGILSLLALLVLGLVVFLLVRH
jgi:WD40 repeat protein